MKDESSEIIEEGPVSVVSRAQIKSSGQWLAVKTASIRRTFTKEPHDIIKENRVLSTLRHQNVCLCSVEFKSAMFTGVASGHSNTCTSCN
jgi:hypothetical protein